jgi:prepilin-type N-terminal cleavage/methylation domain-containing protein
LISLNSLKINRQKGFTLVEMLVTLVVSAIVISGTIAGFTYFSKQYETLSQRIAIDRDVLRVIDLIQADINKAGFKAYATGNPAMVKTDVFQGVNSATVVSDFKIVYDDFKDDGTLYRALIHYYLEAYTSEITKTERQILRRDWRVCASPSTGCSLATSTLRAADSGPIIDKVTTFEVLGLNAKTGDASSTFFGIFQALEVNMTVEAPRQIEGNDTIISKNFKFITRAYNVSIVP